MDNEIYIGRQPILDVNQQLYGYELLFRSGNTAEAGVSDDLSATSRVLVNTLNQIGIHRLLGEKKGFVNINQDILEKELHKNLPKEHFVLEILETTRLSPAFLKKIEALENEGYVFAIDDFEFTDAFINTFKPLFERVKIIKVDVRLTPPERIKAGLPLLKKYPLKLLAEKVENMEEYLLYKNMGFDLFQGYFFEKPSVIKSRSIDPEKSAILNVFSLIQKNDDITAIENAFKAYPELTINLLRFINSAQLYVRNHINSIRQAITLIGYRKLSHWLLLMAYASPQVSNKANPLFHTASQRGKTMELLYQALHPCAEQSELDQAFLTGLLSLMGALLASPIEDVLKEMNVSETIIASITGFSGKIGMLLKLVVSTEDSNLDLDAIQTLLNNLNLDLEKLRTALLDSYLWAESFGSE